MRLRALWLFFSLPLSLSDASERSPTRLWSCFWKSFSETFSALPFSPRPFAICP